MAAPDKWTLSGSGINVFYTSLNNGLLHYQDTSTSLNFTGPAIRVVPGTDVGTLVSVTLRGNRETGSTTFTVLLPEVVLNPPTVLHLHVVTDGITTLHSVFPGPGQKEHYTVTPLAGNASL